MDYVNFGSAGVKVSPIALGMGLRGQTSAEEAQRLVEHAIDSGINLIDCANVYGLGDDRQAKGSSEEILGRVLKTRRDEVVITSKVVSPLGKGPNDRGSSRYSVMREVERSLKRLGTDRIDVYLLHGYDSDTPLDETLRALDDIVTQGKARYVGCSGFAAWQVAKALWFQDGLGADPFICVQKQYSLLARDIEGEMFDVVNDQGLGVMAFSPLAVGLLAGHYGPDSVPPVGSPWNQGQRSNRTLAEALNPETMAVIDAVREIAEERGKTAAQVALNWVLSHPEVTVAISGSDTSEQLDENLGALGWELSEGEVERLDQVSSLVGSVEGL